MTTLLFIFVFYISGRQRSRTIGNSSAHFCTESTGNDPIEMKQQKKPPLLNILGGKKIVFTLADRNTRKLKTTSLYFSLSPKLCHRHQGVGGLFFFFSLSTYLRTTMFTSPRNRLWRWYVAFIEVKVVREWHWEAFISHQANLVLSTASSWSGEADKTLAWTGCYSITGQLQRHTVYIHDEWELKSCCLRPCKPKPGDNGSPKTDDPFFLIINLGHFYACRQEIFAQWTLRLYGVVESWRIIRNITAFCPKEAMLVHNFERETWLSFHGIVVPKWHDEHKRSTDMTALGVDEPTWISLHLQRVALI